MRKVGILKGLIAIFLILVVVVATVNYGKSQRSKISMKDNTKSSLPTVEDGSASKQESTLAQNQTSQPKAEPAPAISAPAPAVNAPVQAQSTQAQMPATGAADTIIPVLSLGTLSGLYLVSRRKLKDLS
jgi:FtsZ-interacting cell division protein ZipA